MALGAPEPRAAAAASRRRRRLASPEPVSGKVNFVLSFWKVQSLPSREPGLAPVARHASPRLASPRLALAAGADPRRSPGK